jgi:hypothetical protein
MSDDAAKKIVGLLIDSLQAEARRSLPSFVLDSWLGALSSVIESGLYHAWVAIVSNSLEINAEVVEIIDNREEDGATT